MPHQTEWEIVDDPLPEARGRSRAQVLQALLGRWWKWKLAGLAIVALALAILLAFAAGTVILLGAGLALLAWAARRLKRLLAGDSSRTGLKTWHPTNKDGRRGFVSEC